MSKNSAPRSGRFAKVLLGLILVGGAGGALFYSAKVNGLLDMIMPPPAADSPAQADTRSARPTESRPVDYDALAARWKEEGLQAYWKTVEQQTLSEYDRLNPKDAAWYHDGREAARLFAFRAVFLDCHGENLLLNADVSAQAAFRKGCRDPLVLAVCDEFTYCERHSSAVRSGLRHLSHVDALLASGYPPVLKFAAISFGLKNLIYYPTHPGRETEDMTAFTSQLPAYFEKAMPVFESFVKTSPPPSVIYGKINQFFDCVEDSYDYLGRAGQQMDAVLVSLNAGGAARAYTQGNCHINQAWAARGSGWSDTVTKEGWRKMAQHLKAAEKILDPASDQFPDVPQLPSLMITVELGQGTGPYRMNHWFDKAVGIDPDYYRPYSSKIYYLQPKWHGSPKEVAVFAQECIAGGRWDAAIPVAGLKGLSDLAEYREALYKEPALWDIVSQGSEEWLRRFPDSSSQRTRYFQWAVKAEKWDVARAQLKALGSWWDRQCLDDEEFLALCNAIPAEESAKGS